ncbi:SDR family oxidoreductase [Rhodococcus erythropolis]|uniref:SDR family NAD(P)-dependent oxidoreductase n=1 Tax=Rhodococcus erythropolis TaxID=1833 RepID=UPI00294A3FCE|nr:SDR family oxidoreductase [Rhodococcus erythropolis]MDV6212712.1 SDR family oxidoreductase [Rhodococcus erythropolis]
MSSINDWIEKMRGLKDKVALVTGGASGIGAATVMRLHEEGTLIAIGDIDIDGARGISDELGERVHAFKYDATDPNSITDMVKATVTHFGRLDILHNNAGAVGPDDTTVVDTSVEVWESAMNLNARAYFLCSQAALPFMIRNGGGVVVNTASSSAHAGQLTQTSYGGSKASIVALTQYIATQYGRQNIRANSISPGIVVTPALLKVAPQLVDSMAPTLLTGRLGTPENIASTVAFLASDDARYITGQNLCVDGGLFAHAPYVSF